MGLGLPLWLEGVAIAASNLTALVTCLAVTSVACTLLHRFLPQDILHDDPAGPTARVQRVGGVAALLGISAGATLMTLSGEPVPWMELTAAAVLALMGFMDDLRPQDPMLALTFQGSIGAALGWSTGPDSGWLFLGVAVCLAVVTTARLMDGINALLSWTTVLWGTAAAWVGIATGRGSLVLLGLLAAAAALGFLPWNTRGARLFLGDSGRYLVGGVMAAGIIVGTASDWRVGVLLTLPLSVHLLDVAWTWMLERVHHRPRSAPHRERVYQRLVDEIGLSHPTVSWVVNGFAGAVTLLWFLSPWFLALPASVLLLALYVDLPRLLSAGREPVAADPA